VRPAARFEFLEGLADAEREPRNGCGGGVPFRRDVPDNAATDGRNTNRISRLDITPTVEADAGYPEGLADWPPPSALEQMFEATQFIGDSLVFRAA
jgi:hypothetical protein